MYNENVVGLSLKTKQTRRYRMPKLKAFILLPLSVFFLLASNHSTFAEDITITTYYPAPYGVYNQLVTQTLGVGDTNVDGNIDGDDAPDPTVVAEQGDVWIAGNVGIGTTNPAYSLDVNGNIRAIGSVYYGGTVGIANGTAYIQPDYVFENGYNVMTIKEVEKYLKKENHLPWMTSVKEEQEENGDVINMTRMTFEAVETAENLQLQIIELNKTAEKQAALIKALINRDSDRFYGR